MSGTSSSHANFRTSYLLCLWLVLVLFLLLHLSLILLSFLLRFLRGLGVFLNRFLNSLSLAEGRRCCNACLNMRNFFQTGKGGGSGWWGSGRGGGLLATHLAGPDVNGEVDELRVFLDQVLDGLQFQIVWGLLLQDQSEDLQTYMPK